MENIRERIVSCAGRVWFCAKELLKWLALAMITGVPCGIIGAAFDLAVEHVTELRTEHTAILFLLPVIGLVIVAFYKAAKLEGVSTDDMIDCVKDGKPIRFWLLPVMFISTVLTHLGGGSAGRGRLKADAEEHDLFFGVPLRDVYRVDRRIHDLDPCTEGAAALQTVPRNAARNAQHVAVACNNNILPHRKLQHRVDDGGRSDAHGTSGA